MIYERKMQVKKGYKAPITNWNVFGNVVLFQDYSIDTENKIYMLFCEPYNSAKLFCIKIEN